MKQLRLLFISLCIFATLPASATGFENGWESELDGVRIEASVYPNPTNGVFFLQIDSQFFENFEVKIVNLIGQAVEVRQVSTNERVQFDLTSLPKGFYFVKIQVDQQQVIKRVILQ